MTPPAASTSEKCLLPLVAILRHDRAVTGTFPARYGWCAPKETARTDSPDRIVRPDWSFAGR